MKILIIRSNPADPDSRVEKEAAALKNEGHNVMILAWDRSSDYRLKRSDLVIDDMKIPIYRVGIKSGYGEGFRKNLIPLLRFQRTILHFLSANKKKIDVVHACDFDTAFSAALICFTHGIKLVYDIFDYYVDAFSVPAVLRSVIEYIDHTIINRADAVIICTEQRRKQIGKVSPRKLTVIHNSPENTEFVTDRKFDLDTDAIKVVYVGILSQGRDIPELCRFISEHKEFQLHIGGFGYLEDEIRTYAEENENIIFYGKLPYAQTLELEKACDIVTAIYDPSVKNHIYAAPNKFYEGLFLGKPLIMVRGTGMADIVEKNKLGVLIHYDDVGRGLLALKEMRSEWNDIAIRGKEKYKEEYSWEEMKKRLISLYDSL